MGKLFFFFLAGRYQVGASAGKIKSVRGSTQWSVRRAERAGAPRCYESAEISEILRRTRTVSDAYGWVLLKCTTSGPIWTHEDFILMHQMHPICFMTSYDLISIVSRKTWTWTSSIKSSCIGSWVSPTLSGYRHISITSLEYSGSDVSGFLGHRNNFKQQFQPLILVVFKLTHLMEVIHLDTKTLKNKMTEPQLKPTSFFFKATSFSKSLFCNILCNI